ncbi:hypothetical protein GCM10018779_58660 [Streptomyces griseocarneus]|nr:hypothetical protein GCM10018779_58660 [Streptomyces griseocarneus]
MQVSPGLTCVAAADFAGAAEAGEAARPTVVTAAEAAQAMSVLPMRLTGLVGRIVALSPWSCVFGQGVNVAATGVGV